MNRIKTAFWAILLAISLGGFYGCKKFLDRKPLSATLDDIPGGGVEGQILGLYGAIRHPDASGNGFGGIMWLGIHSARGDDALATADPNGTGYTNIFDKYQYAVDDWGPNTYYEQHYKLQNQANTAIQIIDSLDLTDPDNQRRKAEAMFFRAFTYFDLVRVYGEVPLILKRIYNPSEANVPKSSADEIYAAIDADLTFAEQHLPLNWVTTVTGDNRYPGRLTVGAAKALHAKTYLQRKLWPQALALSNEVINSNEYDLHPSFGQLWTTAGEVSKERIFDIQAYQSAGRKDDYWSWWGTEQGIRGDGTWNLGWGYNTPTKSLLDSFTVDDPRKFETVLFSGARDDTSANYPAVKSRGYNQLLPPYPSSLAVPYWNKKTYADPAEQVLVGDVHGAAYINQPVIRYADVLLMAAEAANETGNGASAETYLEKVRSRARNGQAGVLPKILFVNQQQMRNAIKHERLVELALEGGRFFDLVRWGDAFKVLNPLGYQPKNALYPLPKPEVDKSNGVLKQNPDYQ